MTASDHRARLAGQASRDAVVAKDKQACLDLFAADGCVEDPVGPSVFDPEGAGHHGRDAISAFWDTTIAKTESIEFRFTDSFACGDECAHTGSIRSLRAFWEFDRAVKTMRPA